MLRSLLIASLFSITQNAKAGNIEAEYEYYAKWKESPNVILCSESKVSTDTVKAAMNYWNLLLKNNTFKTLIINSDAVDCSKIKGIKISNQGDVDTDVRYGETNLRKNKKDNLTSATVYISDEYSNNLELVTHELGHALGFLHVDDRLTYDIMHSHHMDEITKNSPNQAEGFFSLFINIDL